MTVVLLEKQMENNLIAPETRVNKFSSQTCENSANLMFKSY